MGSVVEQIVTDLRRRQGLWQAWERIDENIRNEIVAKWSKIAEGGVPVPKYKLGEWIMFNRDGASYIEGLEGNRAGKICSIDIGMSAREHDCDNKPGEWQIRYWCERVDDPIIDNMVLGVIESPVKR